MKAEGGSLRQVVNRKSPRLADGGFAERTGFEPVNRLRGLGSISPLLSATQPPLEYCCIPQVAQQAQTVPPTARARKEAVDNPVSRCSRDGPGLTLRSAPTLIRTDGVDDRVPTVKNPR